jgi:hypothetical protein
MKKKSCIGYGFIFSDVIGVFHFSDEKKVREKHLCVVGQTAEKIEGFVNRI